MATWASTSEPVTSPTTAIPAAEGAAEALTLVVVLQMTLLVVISVTGTFANALVFAVFYRRPSLRTISNRFVLSLVLANLMSALVTIPAHVCNLLPEHNWPTGFKGSTYWDQTLSGLTVLITLASVLSILLISLDRYYAVNSPLHYTIIVTRQKSVAMITLVWLVSVILSAPVWSGGVTLDNQLIQAVPEGNLRISSGHDVMHAPALIVEDGVSSLSGSDATQPSGDETETLDDGVSSQRRVINLSYTISLLFFGFLSPLAALCWLYLRMYEAALKNSARTGTRRQSLCSNAAAETGALTLATDPLNHNDAIQMNKIHQPSLAEALTAAATAAAIAAASSDPQSTPIRISRLPHDQSRGLWSLGFDRCCLRLRLNGLQQQLLTVFWREEGRALRTTAMVISSFLCCWLPFFLSLLPLHQERHWIFAARLTAFANVLVSPAIYVYRNKVAQREAGRLLVTLFCPCPDKSSQRSAAAGAGHSNVPSYQATPVPMLHTVHLRPTHLSHQSSLSSGSSDTDTPRQRRSADERADDGDVSFKPLMVVNWRKEGSVKCQVMDHRSAGSAADASDECKQSRASIAGDSALPSASDNKTSAVIHMRQRSLTVSGDVVPHSTGVRRPKDGRTTQETVPVIPPEVPEFGAMRCHSQTQWCRCTAPPRRTSSEELKMLNYQTYPSLDFFDIGLEDYGRRAASFSRFVQNHSTPMAASVPAASTTSVANSSHRKRRTSSFSKVLLSRHKQSKSSQHQPKCSASSMPSVQETKSSFVTAV